jgi:hypothetical protein
VVLEAPTLFADFDDVAMRRQPVEQHGRRLGVAEHEGRSPNARLMVTMIP